MPSRLPASERAKVGLALIREAVIDLLGGQPGGLTGDQIDAALGFPQSTASGFPGIFGMTLRQSMEEVEKREGRWYLRE